MASRDSGLPGGGGGRSQGPGVAAQQAAAASRQAGPKSGGSATSSQQVPSASSADILRVLQGATLFKGFTETGLQIVGSIAQQKHFPANTPIFVENMIGDGLFIIAEGMIRISVRGP